MSETSDDKKAKREAEDIRTILDQAEELREILLTASRSGSLTPGRLAELNDRCLKFQNWWRMSFIVFATPALKETLQSAYRGLERQLDVLKQMVPASPPAVNGPPPAASSPPTATPAPPSLERQLRDEAHRRRIEAGNARIRELQEETRRIREESLRNQQMSFSRSNEMWRRAHLSGGSSGFYCPRCLRQYPDHHRICVSCGPYTNSLYGYPF